MEEEAGGSSHSAPTMSSRPSSAATRHTTGGGGRYCHSMGTWAADWLGPITNGHWPRVQCPACEKGFLTPTSDNIDELHDAQSAQTLRLYEAGLDSVHHLSGAFSKKFVCEWDNCRQQYVVGGNWELSIDDIDPDHGPHFVNKYRLQFIHPTIPLFKPPSDTPIEVEDALREAAAIIWMSPNGAANQMRRAVEALLTSRGVKQLTNLHDRIRLLEQTSPREASVLQATKVIGNAGSHGQNVTVNDALDAAEFIELALRLFYDTSDQDVLNRAARIVRTNPFRHAPPRTA